MTHRRPVGNSFREWKKVNETKTQRQSSQTFPKEIQALVDKAKAVFTPQQALDFQKLLASYKNIFSTKDEPLGQSEIAQHDIQTTEEPE